MGWGWPEAPLYALLDLLTISGPLSRRRFTSCLTQAANDPFGPYGEVLKNTIHFQSEALEHDHLRKCPPGESPIGDAQKPSKCISRPDVSSKQIKLLRHIAGNGTAEDYRVILDSLPRVTFDASKTALLVLDPQYAFTKGVWKQSIGPRGDSDVTMIAQAFESCSNLLSRKYGSMEIMFTRCPFPPESYDWDTSLKGIVAERHPYFIKPGNSVLFPPTNGFREWLSRCRRKGVENLVFGGCTLNSCVRVSAIEVRQNRISDFLRVVVDLRRSAARARNYRRSPRHSGQTAVERAVRQMEDAGVEVVSQVSMG